MDQLNSGTNPDQKLPILLYSVYLKKPASTVLGIIPIKIILHQFPMQFHDFFYIQK